MRDAELEKRIARLEILLLEVLDRLSSLEMLLQRGGGGGGEELRLLYRLVSLYSVPVAQALELAKRLASLVSEPVGADLDELDLAILEAVASGYGESLRSLERAVRRARGRASRRVVRERVEKLVALGLLKMEYNGRRLRLSLAE